MMYRLKESFLRLICSGFITTVVVLSISCDEVDTKIRLEEGTYPPVFKISGSGYSASFVVFGPFENIDEWQKVSSSIEKLTPVWEVNSPPKSDSSVSEYSPLTYGKAPSGFSQKHPIDGGAPPLLEGKTYYLLVPVNSANWSGICFFIKDGKAHTHKGYK